MRESRYECSGLEQGKVLDSLDKYTSTILRFRTDRTYLETVTRCTLLTLFPKFSVNTAANGIYDPN